MPELTRLLRYVRPYWARLTWSVLLMAGVGVLEGATALLLAPVFNRVLQPLARVAPTQKALPLASRLPSIDLHAFVPSWIHNELTVVALIILAVTTGKAVFEYASAYLVNYIGFAVVTDLRNQLYQKLIHQSLRFFHGNATGRLMSAILNDIEKIQIAVSHVLADFLRQSFTLVAMMCVLFIADPWMALVALPLLLAVVLYTSTRIGRKVHGSTRKTQDNLAELSQILQESISGIRVVKAFGMEKFEFGRFRDAARRLFRINLRYVRAQSLSSPLMELLGAVMVVTLLLVGRNQIKQGATAGDFIVFIYALLKIYEPIKRLTGINNAFQQALGASVKVFEYLDLDREVADKPVAGALPPFRKAIVFDKVSFEYEPDRPLLQNISLEARCGEVIALVGASGAGKTTMASLIPRFFDVTGGAVLIDGHDVRDVTVASLRAQIGIVTQETILFNDTVRNNICYGRADTPDAEVFAASRAALAHDFIMELPDSYDSLIGERGARLSGGQRQRIAIARALLKNSPILILDEATSELDSESEVLVQQALANLMEGRTAFVIAHRLSTIRHADKIVVLERGTIVEIGTHAQLLVNGGVYRRLHELQFAAAGQ